MARLAALSLAVLALAVGAQALSTDVDSMWEEFKVKYEKGYGAEEHDTRKEIFARNWALAHERNAAELAVGGEEVHGMSPFLDIEPEEFLRMFTMQNLDASKMPELPVMEHPAEPPSVRGALASSLDWRDKGVVTPVKDQGQCGSCWAFSATESIESANAMAGHSLDELAPQQIVDCDHQDSACNGGIPYQGINYVQQAGGLEGESDYPYTSGQTKTAGSCQFNSGEVKQTTTGYNYATQSGSEGQMVSAMNQNGPLSIVVDASSWQTYSGGVMSNCGTNLDHAVQAVGYSGVSAEMVRATWVDAQPRRLQWDDAATNDATNDQPSGNDQPSNDAPSSGGYWIVRNSWNTSWGESGYIRLAYGGNTCGLTQMVVYAKA
mmetsp:Transcript_119649/g.290388  ORF Transcript_119649/g.290388 Transcript_119649/m.290388 type:complete len:378 (-) Transcript_119649:193-1326(-)